MNSLMLPHKISFTSEHKKSARATDRLCKLVGKDTDLPVLETLENGIFQRVMYVPKDTLISGKVWIVPHVFQLLKGTMHICNLQGSRVYTAPYTVALPYDQRVLYSLEDCIISCIVTTKANTPKQALDESVVANFSQLNKRLRRQSW